MTVSGEGVSPSLTMEPADGVLDLGNVMAGDSVTATATLRNTSAFPLNFTVAYASRLCSTLCQPCVSFLPASRSVPRASCG